MATEQWLLSGENNHHMNLLHARFVDILDTKNEVIAQQRNTSAPYVGKSVTGNVYVIQRILYSRHVELLPQRTISHN